jgi:predicted metalloprotease with PDZ domain
MPDRNDKGAKTSRRSHAALTWLVTLTCAHVVAATAWAAPSLQVEVDARDLPRRLLHTRICLPCQPGTLQLWFPKWVPGTHGPYGPVQNIGGLRFQSAEGKALRWRRDEVEPYRIACELPEGTHQIEVQLDTICNEPALEAAGFLSFGNASVGMINWGTCLLYPEGPPCDDIQTRVRLRLPKSWHFATSLKAENATEEMVTFEPVSLTDLVDCPLIAGEHLRTIPLKTGSHPPAFLDLVSESPSALQLSPRVIDMYSRVVREAGALFGECHYPEFHFLVTCSDQLGYHGLEHLTCSMNGVRENDLIDDARRRGWVANLLPHEYVHSWCGKYRRPAGMCTPNFHTPQKTRLLWVYEGLTEYLGEVLMARSGLLSPREYREMLAANIRELSRHVGRKWRSLEDTAVASHMLRAPSSNWNDLRRGQDYYFEGSLLWLEADAILRERSQNKKSLDDFCRKFLGGEPTNAKMVPYDIPEIVRILRELVDFEWERFFESRVAQPLDALPLEVVDRCGYRLQHTSRPPGEQVMRRNRGAGGVSAQDSIGLAFDGDGNIIDVVPGMIGDKTGLASGMKLIGINGKTFSRQRVLDALADSVTKGRIELLIVEGDAIRTVVLSYAGGPRYLALVRNPSKPDLLAAILKPKEGAARPDSPAARAQSSPALAAPRGYVCYRAQTPVQIDGRIEEPAWKAVPWTDEFVDIEGDKRPRPRFQTRVKMLWDDSYFYVAALLVEPHVWGTLTKHDSVIFHDNDFEIFIDPDGDNHEYYEIEINALNTEWDLFLRKPYRDGGPAVNEWEIPGLKTAIHVTGTLNDPKDRDTSWSVEVAIPWKVLAEFAHRSVPPKDRDQWRVNFSRVEWEHQVVEGRYQKTPGTPEHNWVWSPQGVIDMHRPERWGVVQFSTLAPGQAQYTPDPSGPIRDRLMQIYYAEKQFHEKHTRWAASLEELELPHTSTSPGLKTIIRLTPDGYEAEVTGTSPTGGADARTVRQDSRIQKRNGGSPASMP